MGGGDGARQDGAQMYTAGGFVKAIGAQQKCHIDLPVYVGTTLPRIYSMYNRQSACTMAMHDGVVTTADMNIATHRQ